MGVVEQGTQGAQAGDAVLGVYVIALGVDESRLDQFPVEHLAGGDFADGDREQLSVVRTGVERRAGGVGEGRVSCQQRVHGGQDRGCRR
ncbi:hypothetical protein ACIGO9_31855 [Nocardia asteroides]|uniref:hypothetical protein n=1 Tax=Nocardia asteroides TaxID=1824 RepID=UPI0037C5BC83